MKFKVEHRFMHGWDDAGWEIDGKPMRFDSIEAADGEIKDFFNDVEEAVKNSDMEEGSYLREDFRVVPVEE